MKQLKTELIKAYYANRTGLIILAVLIGLVIIGQIQQSTPEMR